MSKSVKRLFSQFAPENYNLKIEINPESMSFSGKVVITGRKVDRPSQRITFHQKELTISSATITKHDKKGASNIAVSRINRHKSLEEIRIHTDAILYPGLYVIDMEFSGNITKSMVGLYPSFFKHNGQEKIIFATQFESHHAREVFPCIDEPEAKSTFDLTLITPAGQEVLANTFPAKQTKLPASNQLRTSFEQTPLMSTYLLAFAFGDIHCVEGKTKSGITLRSWASLAQPKENLQFSLDEGIKILDFYEDYFDTAFPLKKLDQLALPDFDSGAMENWGLITYREIAMLTDPKNPSVPGEQYVAMVIAHELSHQWFGNLVTMRWWDDLWLNESFASLIEHLCLDALHPDWHQWEQYASSDIISCSNRDIYSNVQPVGVQVKHPDEIITLFDPAIVYAKGGRLLKMMREYIGEAAFKDGLKEYFKIHAFKNTVRDDLWESMSNTSGKDINALMTPWLTQSGMPVVTISGGEESHTRKISQKRFVLDKDDDKQIWPIPLLASSKVDPELLSQPNSTLRIDSNNMPILNKNGSGHFVTHYDFAADLENVISAVTEQSVPSESRINILNDLMLLSRSGRTNLSTSLKVIRAMKSEPRDAVWTMMARGLSVAAGIGENNEFIESAIKQIRYDLSSDNYKRLGWVDSKDEDLNTVSLRATTLSLMISSENETIINDTLQLFESYKKLQDIPADRRGHLLGTAVRHGGEAKTIDQFIHAYQSTADPDLQLSISSALCFTKSSSVAKRLCDEAMGKNGFVRDQDLFRWFAYLMRNKYTREEAWNWLEKSWDRIAEDAGGAKSLEYYIWYAAGPLQTVEWLEKFNEMFEPKKSQVVLRRNIEIAQSEIAARIAWRNRELPGLEKYLKTLQ